MIDRLLSGWFGKTLYFLICLGFLAFGLVRLGAGLAALAQLAGWIEIGEMTEAIGEVGPFLTEHADQSLYAFGVPDYFAYIALMGAVLVAGTIGAMRYKAGGIRLMALYLVLHGALFLNAMVINPKLVLLAVTVGLVGILAWLRPRFAKRRR